MEYMLTRFLRHQRPTVTGILTVIVCFALVTGCGGGGAVQTTIQPEGFRIVPDGGPVVPLTGLVLNTLPGVVDSGVQVTATAVTVSTHPIGTDTPALGAVQLQFSPDSPKVNSAVKLTLPYTTNPTSETDLHIYYSSDGIQWVILPPVPGSSTGSTSGTVSAYIEALDATSGIPIPNLKSGTYAIFGDTHPAAPSL